VKIRYVFQVVYKHRRKLADWLDKGKGVWWLKPLLKKKRRDVRTVAVWPAPRRYPTRLHRFPAWLFQQGAYWISNVRRQRFIKARRTFLPPPPRRSPTRQHRFPAWLVQQGPYWWRRRKKRPVVVSAPSKRKPRRIAAWLVPVIVATFIPHRRKRVAVRLVSPPHRATRQHRFPSWLVQQGAYWFKPLLRRQKLKARWIAVWPAPRRAPTRQHRFPTWLVQQGTYWWRRKPKRPALAATPPRRKRHGIAAWFVPPAVAVSIPRHRRRVATAALPPTHHRRHGVAAWYVPPVVVSAFTPRRRRTRQTVWDRVVVNNSAGQGAAFVPDIGPGVDEPRVLLGNIISLGRLINR
jgi:hypothetical protein